MPWRNWWNGLGRQSGNRRSAPVNSAIPTILGTAANGSTLTAVPGIWSGNQTPTFGYQWFREGVLVVGRTALIYLVGPADIGMALTIRERATNTLGSASATSAATTVASGAASGQTNVFREMFAEGTTFTAGAPGSNFSAFAGTGNARFAGPRLSAGAVGGSSCCGGAVGSTTAQWGGAWTYTALGAGAQPYPIGSVEGWFFFEAIPTTAGNNLNLLGYQRTGGATYGITTVGSSGGALGHNSPSTLVGNVQTFVPPLRQWVYLKFAIDGTAALKFRSYYMRLGTDAAPVLFDSVDNAFPINDFNRAYFFLQGTSGCLQGRIGAASAYKHTSLAAAAAYAADTIPPVDGWRTTYYTDAATGNDSNTGRSGSPWQTWSKVVAEVGLCTLMGGKSGWVNATDGSAMTLSYSNPAQRIALADAYDLNTPRPDGDSVLFVPGTDIPITASLAITRPGITLASSVPGTRATLPMSKIVTGWTQYDSTNFPNIWMVADSQTSSILWEDLKWLNHPQGAAIANVRTSLNTTPGSYWTDGTTMYLNPFGNTNPNSDGKTYTRSRNLGGTLATAISGRDSILVKDLDVSYGAVIDNLNSPGVPAQYHLALEVWSGWHVWHNCRTVYHSKHPTAAVGDGSGGFIYRKNCVAGQGVPWSWKDSTGTSVPSYDGGVDFYGPTVGDANLVSIWRGCSNTAQIGVVGSTAGVIGGGAYYTHTTNASGRQIQYLEFRNCDFTGGSASSNADSVAITAIYDTTMSLFWYAGTGGVATANRCVFGFGAAQCTAGTFTLTDCLVKWVGAISASSDYDLTAALIFNSCTLDFSGAIPTGGAEPVWQMGVGGSLTFADCAIVLPTAAMGLAGAGSAAKPISITRTAVQQSSPAHPLFTAYDDGATVVNRTYAQAVTLGLVTAAVNGTNIGVNTASNAALLVGSACIGLAAARANAPDLTGVVFATRDDAGAREYV